MSRCDTSPVATATSAMASSAVMIGSLNLELPLSMGGEVSVLNALRTGLQHLPSELGVWSDQTATSDKG